MEFITKFDMILMILQIDNTILVQSWVVVNSLIQPASLVLSPLVVSHGMRTQ